MAEVAEKRQSHMTGEEEYEKIVLFENLSCSESLTEVHTIDEALRRLRRFLLMESWLVNKHPQKVLKASIKGGLLDQGRADEFHSRDQSSFTRGYYRQSQGYGLAADIWSLGRTVLEMLTRHIPFHPLEFQQALFRIANGELPPIRDRLSADARDFIQQCLRVNPDDCPTAATL